MERNFTCSPPARVPVGTGSRVSSVLVRALLEAAATLGASVDELLQCAGITTGQVVDPYGWFDTAEFDRLIEHAVVLTCDPAFGLHWAERSPMMKFELLAMPVACAATLREGLDCVLRFQRILSDRPGIYIVEKGAFLVVHVATHSTTELGARVRAEVVVSGLVRLLRTAGAPAVAVRRVAFAYGAPSYADEYRRVFDGRARFEQAWSGIEIEAACLDRLLFQANADLHKALMIEAQHVLTRVQCEVGVAGQVRDHLRLMFPRLPSMRETARALSLSERTLRRRLAEEGESYSAILQEGQARLARQLLADPTRTVKEVGYEIGFSNPGAFYRAFKRWTGEAPGSFKAANR